MRPAFGGSPVPRLAGLDGEPKSGITLAVDMDGKYYVEDEPVTDAGLGQALHAAYASRPGERTLYLKAHDHVDYSRVLTAVDAARTAKVRRITAIVELAYSPR